MASNRFTPKSKPSGRKLLAPKQDSQSDNTETGHPKSAIRVLFSWVSPDRIWKPKTQVWYLVSALVIMLAILLAVKLEYYVFVIALLAFLMLWFIQGTLAPLEVKHQITNQGIYTFETFHRWDELAFFWFAERDEWRLLYFDFKPELKMQRLNLLVKKGDDDEIFNILITHLKYGEEHEVGYNLFAQLIYGTYLPITKYIPDLDTPTAKELKVVAAPTK